MGETIRFTLDGVEIEAAANVLTNPQLDPYGKIPEFKLVACRVTKVECAMAAE